jgi:hypothetical protein
LAGSGYPYTETAGAAASTVAPTWPRPLPVEGMSAAWGRGPTAARSGAAATLARSRLVAFGADQRPCVGPLLKGASAILNR